MTVPRRPTIFMTVDRHLTAYAEMIRRGQCEELIELARSRAWMDEIGLDDVDRESTAAFLDRVIECLELRPERDFRGAHVALQQARKYWRHPDRYHM
jgi:hypothetical protein